MKMFRQLSKEELENKIKAQNRDVTCECWAEFCVITPPYKNKQIQLSAPYVELKQLISEYFEKQNNSEFAELVRQKLGELAELCCLHAEYDARDLSSLKLRVAIDNPNNLPEPLVLGLIHFLIEEANSDQNNMKFDFKILIPEYFNIKEQFTLYFDKDTPIADLVNLTKKVENYLKREHHLPDNRKPSEKNRCYFNSFVSAFFDNNKLLRQYAKYPFFDIEFETFFKNHHDKVLEYIPLEAFDVVFYNIITSEDITLDIRSYSRLKTKERLILQKEFNQLIADPQNYIQASINKIKVLEETKAREYASSIRA